jgi:plasmid maintenance system antidote protein VapI
MKLNKRKIEIELARLEWTKYRLAKEMGVTRQWVYTVLGRNGGCTLRTVDRIAHALGADPKDLLT